MSRGARLGLLPATVLSLVACGGGAVEKDDDKPPMEDPPPSGDSLLRNPEHPLSCERPITENPLTAPLARLTDREYANTLRDLFAGVVDAGKLPAEGDLPAEPVEGLFSNNVTIQRMNTARADLYERTRRTSFLVAILFMMVGGWHFLPAADSGYVTIDLDGYRGLYNSAWVGASMALLTSTFLNLVIVPVLFTRWGRSGVLRDAS